MFHLAMAMAPAFLSVRKSYLFGMVVVSASLSGFLWDEEFESAAVLPLAPALPLSPTVTAGAFASGAASALAKETLLVTAKVAESASGAASALVRE